MLNSKLDFCFGLKDHNIVLMYCIAYNAVKYQQDVLKFKKLKSSIDWS